MSTRDGHRIALQGVAHVYCRRKFGYTVSHSRGFPIVRHVCSQTTIGCYSDVVCRKSLKRVRLSDSLFGSRTYGRGFPNRPRRLASPPLATAIARWHTRASRVNFRLLGRPVPWAGGTPLIGTRNAIQQSIRGSFADVAPNINRRKRSFKRQMFLSPSGIVSRRC